MSIYWINKWKNEWSHWVKCLSKGWPYLQKFWSLENYPHSVTGSTNSMRFLPLIFLGPQFTLQTTWDLNVQEPLFFFQAHTYRFPPWFSFAYYEAYAFVTNRNNTHLSQNASFSYPCTPPARPQAAYSRQINCCGHHWGNNYDVQDNLCKFKAPTQPLFLSSHLFPGRWLG